MAQFSKENGNSNESFIPIVSKETLEGIKSQYENAEDGQSWGDRLTEMQHALVDQNPQLVEFMEMQVGRFPHEVHTSMFEVIIGTLVVIDRQMGADDLSSQFEA